jgi:molybdate transport system substrate-binding protein
MRKLLIAATKAALGLGGILLLSSSPNAAEIHTIVTGALTGAFRELVPQFERQSGNKVVVAWGPSSGTTRDAIPVRIQSGEPVDVLIMISPALDSLIKQGRFTPATRVDIARSGIGVGVRTGIPKPDVSSADALKRALLEAKSIGYSQGASGVYVSTELLKRLGISEQIAGKLKKITGELVGEAIARGEVDMGIQQISELRAVPGVEYVGPLPSDLQLNNVISAAVSKDAKEPDAARAFVAFLSSPDASAAITSSGLDVPLR